MYKVFLKIQAKLGLNTPFLFFTHVDYTRVSKYLILKMAPIWPFTEAATPRRGCKLEMKSRIIFLPGDFKFRFLPFRGC